MTQTAHKITIETRQEFAHAAGTHTRYRPVCSCRGYSAAWGYTRANAEQRGRAHVDRAAAADARRAGIIAGAIGAPVVGKNRPGGVAGKRARRG